MALPVEIPAHHYARKAGVCEFLDCGPTFVHKLVHAGKLTPIRLSRRLTVYDLAEAEKLIEAARSKEAV